MPQLDPDALHAFFAEHFPQAVAFGFRVTEATDDGCTLVLPTSEQHLRPGATLSGPTLMTLADTAMYASVLARLGPVAQAVTSSLQIHFLRRPTLGEVTARCELLKVGRRLAVGRVELSTDDDLVAHATVTYAIPPT